MADSNSSPTNDTSPINSINVDNSSKSVDNTVAEPIEASIPAAPAPVKAAPAAPKYEEIDFSFLKEPETHRQKLARKVKENPLVPVGMGLTVAALVLGIANFQKGNQKLQQTMMRARVLAQGGTIVALVGGLYLAATRDKK